MRTTRTAPYPWAVGARGSQARVVRIARTTVRRAVVRRSTVPARVRESRMCTTRLYWQSGRCTKAVPGADALGAERDNMSQESRSQRVSSGGDIQGCHPHLRQYAGQTARRQEAGEGPGFTAISPCCHLPIASAGQPCRAVSCRTAYAGCRHRGAPDMDVYGVTPILNVANLEQ